jgi:hypothetical protein
MARTDDGRHDRDHCDHCDHSTCGSRRHEPDEAVPPAPGLRVCAACRDVAEETLIELPALFDMCAFVLDPRPNDPSEWISKIRPQAISLCDAVVEVRSEILGVLTAWSGLVITERRVPGPDELSIRKLVGFLGIHVHWLCRHPTAPDLVDELVALTATVNAAVRPAVGFRAAVGTCLRPGCGRTVYAEAYREGLEPYEVACDAGHVWAPERWLSLGGKYSGDGIAVDGTAEGGGNGAGKGPGDPTDDSMAPRPETAE